MAFARATTAVAVPSTVVRAAVDPARGAFQALSASHIPVGITVLHAAIGAWEVGVLAWKRSTAGEAQNTGSVLALRDLTWTGHHLIDTVALHVGTFFFKIALTHAAKVG